jgi:ADP-ribose pyrophosphatase
MPEVWKLARVSRLPAPQAVELHVELVEREPGGFLRRVSRVLRIVDARLPMEAQTVFRYDEVERRALDAVVIVPHFTAPDGAGSRVRWVVLRSAVRPPVLLRDPERFRGELAGGQPLWEVPAGLVEPDEEHDEGLRWAAARELEEETGFSVSASQMRLLGPPTYPCPGVVAERQYFFAVDVTDVAEGSPSLDGSPLEAVGEVVAVPLVSALNDLGRLGPVDAKTELALRRLEALYGDT